MMIKIVIACCGELGSLTANRLFSGSMIIDVK